MPKKECTIEKTYPYCTHRFPRRDHCTDTKCPNYYGKCPEHKGT